MQIGYSFLNMIQTICLLIHVFHNNTLCSTKCYDPQYQKSSEGQQKYHMKSYHHQELSLLPHLDLIEHTKLITLLPHLDLIEHTKLINAVKSHTEGNIYCFYQEIYTFDYILFDALLLFSMLDNKQIGL